MAIKTGVLGAHTLGENLPWSRCVIVPNSVALLLCHVVDLKLCPLGKPFPGELGAQNLIIYKVAPKVLILKISFQSVTTFRGISCAQTNKQMMNKRSHRFVGNNQRDGNDHDFLNKLHVQSKDE